ncbi:uncharacterized protein LOC123713997 isoform X2 [Pieris brassicae]|uniref:uncharacterized protein LOC123713997 isoform X2 n=1 Tax=Pieris brassicae TaxID=7116 RepID=UPI001E66072E|nr:uncharacterized protein LOC123713997 isoform X2 [Pieris brassicae]
MNSQLPKTDLSFIEAKRRELKEFFKDLKVSQNDINKVIENELKALIEDKHEVVPYIAASGSGDVKSEYDVMSGQPFTEIADYNKPLNSAEVKEMIKDNPIIAEKARQIQITTNREGRAKGNIIPYDQINMDTFDEMTQELCEADGDADKIKKIKYKNMQALCKSVDKYAERDNIKDCVDEVSRNDSQESSSDEKEFQSIDKIVSELTNKSHETRFNETKDMLRKLADKYDDPNQTESRDRSRKLIITDDPILKASSSQIIKGVRRRSAIDEIKESYKINETMNISLLDNPVKLDLRSIQSKQESNAKTIPEDEIINEEEVFPTTFEAKIKHTEKALKDINSILNTIEVTEDKKIKYVDTTDQDLIRTSNDTCVESLTNKIDNGEQQVKFDLKMEETLQNRLENIYESGTNDNVENKQLEFKEMKNLARNIVDGAENLSLLIREDITNKLNSMNELLNDVNVALENSRKSNLAYQKLREESEQRIKSNENHASKTQYTELGESSTKCSVTQLDLNNIHSAISSLNTEIHCHEDRIKKSKASCEMRTKECQEFVKEINNVLQVSHEVLHPKLISSASKEKVTSQEDTTKNSRIPDDISNKTRKELWDVEIIYKDEKNKNMAEQKQQELLRTERINDLLLNIKDKMKDNKEVLRIANNLLRNGKSENVTENLCKIIELPADNDIKAQGDHVRNEEKNNATLKVSEVPLLQEDKKDLETEKKEDKVKQKQREFKIKIEKEFEEENKGPRMTKEFIRKLCKQHKLYCTPYLNDILYLHFKGFSRIENLEEYTGLKCIFLENNGIQRIEGLDTLSELKCLYLHYNIVRKIENLDGCPKLDTLNLDHNFVTKIENLNVVPDLHTLSIGHNMLTTVEDLEHLRTCKNLSVVDLSYNRLEDPLIVDVLADMSILKVLVLTGNPVVRNIPAYRKTLTLRLKELLNLDNRPVFPRDRACAEAWQRGGVQEEIAERQRWIARDQEKVMESVRYLMKMKEENRAKREAREREAREQKGLPLKEEEKEEADEKTTVEGKVIEMKTKDGVAVDMLSGSEAEDSTSESSSDSDADSEEDGTSKIEWSHIEKGKTLVQEMKEERPSEPDDYWPVFGKTPSTVMGDMKFSSDAQSLSNILFGQTPHTIKKDSKGNEKPSGVKIIEVHNDESLNLDTQKKPLIEIIDKNIADEDTPLHENVTSNITETHTVIIDHDRKLLMEKCSVSKSKFLSSEKKVKIAINEVQKEITGLEESMVGNGGSDETAANNTVKEETGYDVHGVERRRRVAQSKDDGVALINFLGNTDLETNDEALHPSAEDLEIFAELEREQLERDARIARGEPAVDPMKLYDKKIMDEYHKNLERVPAHQVTEKNFVTTYRKDNGYDRIALSQLTMGVQPDPNKVKLTHVPGAVLFEYVEKQKPIELQYEIGEEHFDSPPSSEETQSINIDSDSNSEDIDVVPKQETAKTRPKTAVRRRLMQKDDAVVTEGQISFDAVEDSEPSTSGVNSDRDEAKRTIIRTINSCDDDRFPSQGTNFADMEENARIEDTVASQILDRTLQYEEAEHYRQCGIVTSHAGKVDNRTNSIIESISEQLDNQYTIPEVSQIVDAHIGLAEQRWRAGEYVHYIPSPPESIIDNVSDNDTTLVPSNENLFEETLTEENKQVMVINEAKDSGIGNDKLEDSKAFEEFYEPITNESKILNLSVSEEVFEDCVDTEPKGFDRVDESYSLEMKIALAIDKK